MRNDRLKYIESIIKATFSKDVDFTIIEEKNITIVEEKVISSLISHDNEVPLKTKEIISVLFKISKRKDYYFSIDFEDEKYVFFSYDNNKFENKKKIEKVDLLYLLSLKYNDLNIEEICEEDKYFELFYNYLSNKFYKVKLSYSISFFKKNNIITRKYLLYVNSFDNESLVFELERPELLSGEFNYSPFSIFSNSWKENPHYQIFLNYKNDPIIKIKPKYKDKISESFSDSYTHHGIDKNKDEKIIFKHFFDKESFFGKVSEYVSLLELKLEIPLSNELYKNPDYLKYNVLTKDEKLKRYNSLLISMQNYNVEIPENDNIEILFNIIQKNENIIEKIHNLYNELKLIKLDLKEVLDKELYIICESNFNKIEKLRDINELRYKEQLTLYLKKSQEFIGNKLNSSILEKIS